MIRGARMNANDLRSSTAAVVTVRDAAAILGVNARTLTGALSIHGGEIRAVRVGRRVVIPRSSFLAWLDGAATDEAPEAVAVSDAAAVVRQKLIALLSDLESVV